MEKYTYKMMWLIPVGGALYKPSEEGAMNVYGRSFEGKIYTEANPAPVCSGEKNGLETGPFDRERAPQDNPDALVMDGPAVKCYSFSACNMEETELIQENSYGPNPSISGEYTQFIFTQEKCVVAEKRMIRPTHQW
jgi:hypothetical protein